MYEKAVAERPILNAVNAPIPSAISRLDEQVEQASERLKTLEKRLEPYWAPTPKKGEDCGDAAQAPTEFGQRIDQLVARMRTINLRLIALNDGLHL